jgi:hypothetical protein
VTARRARSVVASVVLVLVLAACGSTATTTSTRPAVTGPRTTYVAVGGSDSVGNGTDDPLLDAWPQQFFRHSLPLEAVFVNAAVPGSTVADAITDQAPLASSLRATVVTVWLVSADLLDGTPASTYATQLLQLLRSLRAQGATVLVGNAPPLDQLPGYPACRDGTGRPGRGLRCPVALPDPATLAATTSAYDQAIAADAAQTGSILVDLQGAVATSVAHGGAPFLDPSGADLSTAGSTLVAQAFGDAVPAGTRHTAWSTTTDRSATSSVLTRRKPAASARAPTASAPTSTHGNQRLTAWWVSHRRSSRWTPD